MDSEGHKNEEIESTQIDDFLFQTSTTEVIPENPLQLNGSKGADIENEVKKKGKKRAKKEVKKAQKSKLSDENETVVDTLNEEKEDEQDAEDLPVDSRDEEYAAWKKEKEGRRGLGKKKGKRKTEEKEESTQDKEKGGRRGSTDRAGSGRRKIKKEGGAVIDLELEDEREARNLDDDMYDDQDLGGEEKAIGGRGEERRRSLRGLWRRRSNEAYEDIDEVDEVEDETEEDRKNREQVNQIGITFKKKREGDMSDNDKMRERYAEEGLLSLSFSITTAASLNGSSLIQSDEQPQERENEKEKEKEKEAKAFKNRWKRDIRLDDFKIDEWGTNQFSLSPTSKKATTSTTSTTSTTPSPNQKRKEGGESLNGKKSKISSDGWDEHISPHAQTWSSTETENSWRSKPDSEISEHEKTGWGENQQQKREGKEVERRKSWGTDQPKPSFGWDSEPKSMGGIGSSDGWTEGGGGTGLGTGWGQERSKETNAPPKPGGHFLPPPRPAIHHPSTPFPQFQRPPIHPFPSPPFQQRNFGHPSLFPPHLRGPHPMPYPLPGPPLSHSHPHPHPHPQAAFPHQSSFNPHMQNSMPPAPYSLHHQSNFNPFPPSNHFQVPHNDNMPGNEDISRTHPPPPQSTTPPFDGAKTSTDDKKVKDFKAFASTIIVRRMSKYFEDGKISDKEEFKHVSRKLTHQVLSKERTFEKNSSTEKKIKVYVDAYLGKMGKIRLKKKDKDKSKNADKSKSTDKKKEHKREKDKLKIKDKEKRKSEDKDVIARQVGDTHLQDDSFAQRERLKAIQRVKEKLKETISHANQ